MQKIKSSELILKKVRQANLNQIENRFEDVDLEKEIYRTVDDEPEIVFAQELNNNGGTFVFCEDEKELAVNLSALIKERNQAGFFTKDREIMNFCTKHNIPFSNEEDMLVKSESIITRCEFLISRLGSVLISSRQDSGRRANFVPKTHIVIADTSQIKSTVKEALTALHEKYKGRFPSMTTLITGPSRTADIEKTLVMGMHGPQELIIFMLDEPLSN